MGDVALIVGMVKKPHRVRLFMFEKLGVTQEGKVIGRFRATGVRPKMCERLRACGINLPADMFEGVMEIR